MACTTGRVEIAHIDRLRANLKKSDREELERSRCSGSIVQMNYPAQRETADRMSGAAVNLILKTADHIGIDLQSVLGTAGLPPPVRKGREILLPENLSSERLATAFQALIAAVCKQSPQLGVFDSPAKADVDLFCYCLINCDTLAAVIDRAIRFTRISNNRWGGLRVDVASDEVIFSTDARRCRNAAGPAILDVFGLAFFFKLFSWLIGEPLRLQRVQFVHDDCADSGVLANLFGCSMAFGADCTALVFDIDDLGKPVVRTYRELAATLESVPVPLLALPGGMSTQSQVEMIFHRALETNTDIPGLDQVADMLGQSASTLRRNLLREQTSFQVILDGLRRQRAMRLLRETGMTLDDISSMLGFSAPSVFSRAFKSWTGRSPSAYRAEE